ncbi:MAG: hypothetical protein ABIJ56_03620 [Pseudomonadota bacterium]
MRGLLVILGVSIVAASCAWFDADPVIFSDGNEEDAAVDWLADSDAVNPDILFDQDIDVLPEKQDPDLPLGPDAEPADDAADMIDVPPELMTDVPPDTAEDTADDDAEECIPEGGTEMNCDDGVDNDCDGSLDCADLDCMTGPDCCLDSTCDAACRMDGWDGGNCSCGLGACNCALDFEDDFTTEGAWWVTTNPDCEYFYDGPVYGIKVLTEFWICWSNAPAADPPADFTVEVDCLMASDDPHHGCGVVFRLVSNDSGDNYYIFEIENQGRYRLMRHAPDWATLINWTDSPAILGSGHTNNIDVTVIGADFELCVNDQHLASHSDGALSEGGISLAAISEGSGNAEAFFDNFRLFDE